MVNELDDKKLALAKFPTVGKLGQVRTAWLIDLLSEYGESQVQLVKAEFEELFPETKISVEIVRQVASLYSEQIDELAKNFKERIAKIPIAQRHWRLRALNKLLKICMQEDVIKGYWKCGEDEYDENKLINGKHALDIIMAAEKIQGDAERFEEDRRLAERRLFVDEVKAGIRKPHESPNFGGGRQGPSRTKKSSQSEWMQPTKADIGLGKVVNAPKND